MVRTDVIAGLRQLFVEGTAFSGLVSFVISQHPGERVTAGLVRMYIAETFGVSFHESVPMAVESPEAEGKYATISASLLPEIVSSFASWSGSLDAPIEPLWFDDFRSAHSVSKEPIAGISETGWSVLSAIERDRLTQMEASIRMLWDNVLLFARLAERLQRRLGECDGGKSEELASGSTA